MSFIDEILRRGSVSIVGLAKNAGKTEVLNYVLREAADGGHGGGSWHDDLGGDIRGSSSGRGEVTDGVSRGANGHGKLSDAEVTDSVCRGKLSDGGHDDWGGDIYGAGSGYAGSGAGSVDSGAYGQRGVGAIAVTSIGLDGESVDQVSRTPKPEIEIYEGMVFVTSETHYRQKRLVAEVLDVGVRETSLGRLVTARALTTGKVMLSGPPDTASLRALIAGLGRFGVRTTIVDGALSRLSHGSPAVTDAMVLVTGAAVSGNIPRLVRETKYVYDRIKLDTVDDEMYRQLAPIESGVWAVDDAGGVHDLGIQSALMPFAEGLLRHGNTIYAAGAVSDRLLEELRIQKHNIVLIIKDFTRVFAAMENYYAFLAKGGRIKVLQKSELLAVCVNPVSPEGYRLDSDALVAAMEQSLGVPVYDVMRM